MKRLALHGGFIPYAAHSSPLPLQRPPSARRADGVRVIHVLSMIPSAWRRRATHQPVEHLAALRGDPEPGMDVSPQQTPSKTAKAWDWRPCATKAMPSVLCLSRQPLPASQRRRRIPPGSAGRHVVGRAGERRDVTLIATARFFSAIVMQAAKLLAADNVRAAWSPRRVSNCSAGNPRIPG